jgi:protein involved in polysaccharide export with SLBB domain
MKTQFILLLSVGFAFCLANAAETTTTNAPAPASVASSMAELDDTQKLGLGDRVIFRVIEDKDEPRSLTVTDSGQLQVPYYGLVQAVGKTSRELAQEIKTLLEQKHYLRATVIIGVEEINRTRSSGKVYVDGRVRNPGAFDIPAGENLTVSKAILLAGGFSDFADKRNVKLIRKAADGTKTVEINVQDIREKGKLEKDHLVQANDQIFVDQRLVNY